MKKKSGAGSVADLIGHLRKKAPFDYAESWDNVGHLAGSPEDPLKSTVVAVNLGPEALAAAKEVGANVIVCHHPPIFKPTLRLTKGSHPYLHEAMRLGINVIAMHTNFDLASEALGKKLCADLGFEHEGFLAPRSGSELTESEQLGKFITYVPTEDADKVREAVCSAGAGRIGDYSNCTFSWQGEGTFFGERGSKPSVGRSGNLERVQERRLEVVFPWKLAEKIVEAARKAHPYEQMAYDVLRLAQPNREIGYGFVGKSEHLAFHKVIDNVKEIFRLRQVTVAGPGLLDYKDNGIKEMRVRRLAFSPGSGSGFIHAAAFKKADVYVCGEVGYHQMLEARQKGVTLVLLGHSYSERFFVETMSEWCEELTPTQKIFETVHETV